MTEASLRRVALVVSTGAYVAACAAVLLMALPGARLRTWRLAGQQVYAWRRGLWEMQRAPAPRWVAVLARDDLPAEPDPEP